jgi:5-formyltetrahydrofolate cyclo-ligase
MTNDRGVGPDAVRLQKNLLRNQLLRARSERSFEERQRVGFGIAAVVTALVESRRPGTIACYLSVGSEPPTEETLLLMNEIGVPVMVPVLRPDADLNWVRYVPGEDVVAGLRGTIQPADGSKPADLSSTELILVPALAIDRNGHRLGRGGGSYDRALRNSHPTAEIFAVLYDDEVVADLPYGPHDRTVSGAVTASGLRRVP